MSLAPQKTAVIALGGNAISPSGETGTISEQFAHTRESLAAIMNFVHEGYNLCITHGNGPQVGDELLRMDLTHDIIPPLPLGVCVAGTQGTIGYMIEQSLQNELKKESIDREVVTMITQVVVDKDDPAILNPTKFIGPRYTKDEINPLAQKLGWTIAEQNSGEWRRVVPSPLPQYIMHGKSTKALIDRGTIVIASGGGGIPVFKKGDDNLDGLDAVIDKDYAAALFGRILKAEEMWIITDVDCVYLDYNNPSQKPLSSVTIEVLEDLLKEGQFQAGSMAPKIEAALYFLKYHGQKVVITSIPEVGNAIRGKSGTTITSRQ
ncbi:MAG: carbamate kinase [Candidatus Marinimicrobia bacterium]|nr:carbamate kinase [Candidatus Neomarinimicrobiota bacterium]